MRSNVVGTLYIGHIEPRLHHAGHYIGWTERAVETRWAEHVKGKGSPLVKAAIAAGSCVTWSALGSGTRFDERKLHNRKNGSGVCPTCKDARVTAKERKLAA